MNFPCALLATRTIEPSGWALLTGDTGTGAVTLSVDPSLGTALAPTSALELGATGVSGDFEQAAASANKAVAEQRTNLLWSISFQSSNCFLGSLGRDVRRQDDTTGL